MNLTIDAADWVPGYTEDGFASVNGFTPDVSMTVMVNGKPVTATLRLALTYGSYSGNVHSGISGHTTYKVTGIDI